MNLTFTYETELCMRALALIQERAPTLLPEVSLVADISAGHHGETSLELRDYEEGADKPRGRSLFVIPYDKQILVALFWPHTQGLDEATQCWLGHPPIEQSGPALGEIWEYVAQHFDPAIEG
jgi:hypothetical protein